MKKSKLISFLSLSLVLMFILTTVCFAANLQKGSKGTDVKRLQMNLNGLGYNCGNADGIFGNNTENAVKAFQQAEGLEVDGIAGNKTLSAIKNLAKGVQNDLISLGYDPGSVDGIIGNNTIKALKKFQSDYGYPQTGVATDDVRDYLNTAKYEADQKAKKEQEKQAEAGKRAAEEAAKKKAEAEKKAAEETAKKQAEAAKKQAEAAKKQAEAEKKAAEEAAKKQVEAERKAAEEAAKKKAEAEKKVAEEAAKKKAEAKKATSIDTFNRTKSAVNKWYIVIEESTEQGTPLRNAPESGNATKTGNYVKKNKSVYVTAKGKNNSGNIWYQLGDGQFIYSERVREAKYYTITYNANGGKDAPSNQTVVENAKTDISSILPKKDGFIFVGWAETSSATKSAYIAGQQITMNKNLTLYAVWKKQNTTLKIGSGKYDPKSLGKGESYSINGKITSDCNITSVTVGVYNIDGSKTSVVQSAYPNSKSYDIKTLDSKIKFGTLSEGGYRFKVIAVDAANPTEVVLVDNAFKVSGLGLETEPVSITQKQRDYLKTLKGCPQHYDANGVGLCTSCAALSIIWRKEYLITGQAPTITFKEFREAGSWSPNRTRTGGNPKREYSFKSISKVSVMGSFKEKTDYLKALLDRHPEGIFMYCNYYKKSDGNWKKSIHAVALTRYEGDQFYAIDPVGSGKEKKFEDIYLCNGYIKANGFNGSKMESALNNLINLVYINNVEKV